MARITKSDIFNLVDHLDDAAIGALSEFLPETSDWLAKQRPRPLDSKLFSMFLDNLSNEESRVSEHSDENPADSMNVLKQLSSERVHELLYDECAQVICAVLLFLPEASCAEILRHFSVERRSEIILRLAETDEIPTDILYDLADCIREKLAGDLGASKGFKKLRLVMEKSEEQTGLILAATMERADYELAARISHHRNAG